MVLFAASAWLASQGVQAADATQPENITISLERTSCFGPCPIYKVTLRGDGSVTYVGEAKVRVKGTKSRKIDPEAVRDLAREMERAGFFTLRDHYRTVRRPDGVEIRVSDGPTTFVTLTIGERSKRVEDYFGTPKKLDEIERRIDEVGGTKQWAFVDVPTLRAMAREGWKAEGEEADWMLRRALDYDDTEVLRELLDLGIDPDTKVITTNTTPLMVARWRKPSACSSRPAPMRMPGTTMGVGRSTMRPPGSNRRPSGCCSPREQSWTRRATGTGRRWCLPPAPATRARWSCCCRQGRTPGRLMTMELPPDNARLTDASVRRRTQNIRTLSRWSRRVRSRKTSTAS
jgi:hypothetical protein